MPHESPEYKKLEFNESPAKNIPDSPGYMKFGEWFSYTKGTNNAKNRELALLKKIRAQETKPSNIPKAPKNAKRKLEFISTPKLTIITEPICKKIISTSKLTITTEPICKKIITVICCSDCNSPMGIMSPISPRDVCGECHSKMHDAM